MPQAFTTTAFGLAFCIQDTFLFVGPMLSGLVIDRTKGQVGGYFWAVVLFAALALMATVVGTVILASDYYGPSRLYKGPGKVEGSEGEKQVLTNKRA